jgi:hypothetical protein
MTWARPRELARERFLDDELAAESTARETFDAVDTATYIPGLYAAVEKQDVLEAARTATHLREERHEEQRRRPRCRRSARHREQGQRR